MRSGVVGFLTPANIIVFALRECVTARFVFERQEPTAERANGPMDGDLIARRSFESTSVYMVNEKSRSPISLIVRPRLSSRAAAT
jgi:hypothetical protein